MTPSYLTTQQLARHFNVPPSRVRKWVQKGCPCVNPCLCSQFRPFSHLRFKAEDVERWLESFTQPAPILTQLEFPFL